MTDPTPLAGRDVQTARAGAGMGSGPDPEKPHPRGALATALRMAAQQPWPRRGSARGSDGGAAEEAASGRATRPPAEGTGFGRWAASRESRLKEVSAAHTETAPAGARTRDKAVCAHKTEDRASPPEPSREQGSPARGGGRRAGRPYESPFRLVQTSYLLLSQHGYGHVVLPPAVTEGAALDR